MPEPPRRLLPLLLAVALLAGVTGVLARGSSAPAVATDRLGEVGGARYRLSAAPGTAGAVALTPEQRAAGLGFDATVAAADRASVLAALAAARPDAQRLIGLVDGLVDLHAGRPSAGAAGETVVGGTSGRYPVTLDLAGVRARWGERGAARLVLHELGHVVDHALLPDALVAQLDAAIPQGLGCDRGIGGACASREERFAESFAKWATNDIGVNIDLGYQVPPPSLATWGAPLTAFAQAAAGS